MIDYFITPSYGGTKILVDFSLKASSAVAKPNEYKVVAEVQGLAAGDDVRLGVYAVECVSNNEDTLTDCAIESLLSERFNW